MFTELSLGCSLSGHKNLSMYQVSPSTVFFFISYMHIHAPCVMYCLRLVVVVFQEINCLHMPMFVGSQSFISLQSFMFVSAVVSEIRELKEKEKKEKENSEIDYFQFNTFPGHLIYPFFNQRYLLSACTDSIC